MSTIIETKKKDRRQIKMEGGHLMLYRGVEKTKWAQSGMHMWSESITDRILRLEFDIGRETYTILTVHGEIAEFWKKLQKEVEKKKGTLFILKDLNGRVGNCPETPDGTWL